MMHSFNKSSLDNGVWRVGLDGETSGQEHGNCNGNWN